MATEVKLPQLGQTMEEGTIVSCLVEVGSEVKKGEVIFEIETDKATLEMESPADGLVKCINAEVGQTLLVGDVVLVLGAKDEKVAAAPKKAEKPEKAAEKPLAQAAKEPAPKPAAKKSTGAIKPPASAKVVSLPQLGQTMEEGTIVSCLVKVGDKVEKGEVIFEIETDKATLEMESPGAGFVKHILAETGQTVPVGEAVLILADKDEEISQEYIDSLKGAAPEAQPQVEAEKAPAKAPDVKAVKRTGRIIVSPRAKKLAKKMGVDLAAVAGSGPGGRIIEKDVKNAPTGKPLAAPAPQAEFELGAKIPLNRLQRITGRKMLQSKQEIPCFYLTVKADVTELVEYRTKLNQTADVKVAYNDFIIRAVAIGLERFSIMTGQLDGDAIKLAESIGIGLAISVPDGLVAPIVKDVNKKDALQIAKDTKALISRAQSNKLAPTDLEGGCITVSNLGAFGIESFIPIVVPGQCSILGIGQIADTCVPSDGGIAVRKLMSMTLSVDHKVANGAYAAQFLDFVRKLLEDPTTL